MHPTNRDGPMCFTENGGGAPNYWPNSFAPFKTDAKSAEHCVGITGDVVRFETGDENNFSQVTDFWNIVLSNEERERLVSNIAGHLKDAAPFIQERTVSNFTQVHPDFGAKLRAQLKLFSVSF